MLRLLNVSATRNHNLFWAHSRKGLDEVTQFVILWRSFPLWPLIFQFSKEPWFETNYITAVLNGITAHNFTGNPLTSTAVSNYGNQRRMWRGKILTTKVLIVSTARTLTRPHAKMGEKGGFLLSLLFFFPCRSLIVEPWPEVTRSRRSPARLPRQPSPPVVSGHQLGLLGNQELTWMREGAELSPEVVHIWSFSLFLNKNALYIQ